ncbi:hypothetical protein RchiOBHm_Chr1g0376091 [Rosa chinensis]|uniref:Uncharacterized protein n=1 Tax=Rosa chinensis TaxID=74649 RepID=A0A2P6SMQ6_ROSCH|nr:hypothetical protein RchiOBHm_Chr1g0376091 [Rosa chinensis]
MKIPSRALGLGNVAPLGASVVCTFSFWEILLGFGLLCLGLARLAGGGKVLVFDAAATSRGFSVCWPGFLEDSGWSQGERVCHAGLGLSVVVLRDDSAADQISESVAGWCGLGNLVRLRLMGWWLGIRSLPPDTILGGGGLGVSDCVDGDGAQGQSEVGYPALFVLFDKVGRGRGGGSNGCIAVDAHHFWVWSCWYGGGEAFISDDGIWRLMKVFPNVRFAGAIWAVFSRLTPVCSCGIWRTIKVFPSEVLIGSPEIGDGFGILIRAAGSLQGFNKDGGAAAGGGDGVVMGKATTWDVLSIWLGLGSFWALVSIFARVRDAFFIFVFYFLMVDEEFAISSTSNI